MRNLIIAILFCLSLCADLSKYQITILQDSPSDSQPVQKGSWVFMHYTGTLPSGKKFDSSYDRGQPFQTQIGVGHVIKCWDEVVLSMRVGQKLRVVCPSETGYGERGIQGLIPQNSELVFEMELLKVKERKADL